MLDERKAAILKAVIEEYIDTAQPVGSAAVVAAADVRVSPATVRNDMAVLESEGYLIQPHTSAGRVPTEKGYRYFVDHHLSQTELPTMDSRKVSEFFGQLKGEIEGIMRDTAGLLANLTHYAAVVVDDTDEAVDVRSVQLVGLSERLVLAVMVMANGHLTKHTIELDRALSEEDLAEAGALLRAAFEGRPLSASRPLGRSSRHEAERVAYAAHLAVLSGSDPGRVYVEGASRVVNAFAAVESVGKVLTILEQQLVVATLLADVLDRGLTVAIGSETGVDPLSDCSLVVRPYEIDGEHAGTIAVLGPTRMNYQQALSAVAAVSHQLGNRLSGG